MCIAESWNINLPKDTKKSIFSMEYFQKKISRRRSSKSCNLTFDDYTITSHTIAKAIIYPVTALGKAILNRTFDNDVYEKFKDDKFTDLVDYINFKIQVFPKFLITPQNNAWYKWHCVNNDTIVRNTSTISSKYKKIKQKNKIYCTDNLTKYVNKPDYRRYLKNYKSKQNEKAE